MEWEIRPDYHPQSISKTATECAKKLSKKKKPRRRYDRWSTTHFYIYIDCGTLCVIPILRFSFGVSSLAHTHSPFFAHTFIYLYWIWWMIFLISIHVIASIWWMRFVYHSVSLPVCREMCSRCQTEPASHAVRVSATQFEIQAIPSRCHVSLNCVFAFRAAFLLWQQHFAANINNKTIPK